MDFSGIKKAIIDYATELETGTSTIKRNYTGIANVLSDMSAIEDKWTDTIGDIEASINAMTDEAVKASYLGQLGMLRTQRAAVIEMLTALDSAVSAAGLMLI